MQKIGKITEKFTKLDYETEINMDKKGKFTVELMLKTPYKLYRAEEISESVEGSVDVAVESLKNQIIKDKERLKSLRKRGARSIKKRAVIDGNARFRK
jgi:ribosome-associated translation inhibitor RaiA